jgi:hypothetical protein
MFGKRTADAATLLAVTLAVASVKPTGRFMSMIPAGCDFRR